MKYMLLIYADEKTEKDTSIGLIPKTPKKRVIKDAGGEMCGARHERHASGAGCRSRFRG